MTNYTKTPLLQSKHYKKIICGFKYMVENVPEGDIKLTSLRDQLPKKNRPPNMENFVRSGEKRGFLHREVKKPHPNGKTETWVSLTDDQSKLEELKKQLEKAEEFEREDEVQKSFVIKSSPTVVDTPPVPLPDEEGVIVSQQKTIASQQETIQSLEGMLEDANFENRKLRLENNVHIRVIESLKRS